jgi:arabinosaccharide transport system substrate-binding protein
MLGRALSPGAWVLLVAAIVSTGMVLGMPARRSAELEMWTFARVHAEMYEPIIERGNVEHPGHTVRMVLLSMPALERRMLSGFVAGTDVADLIESERAIVGRAFLGPPESIGFLDLTDRIHAEGLDSRINPPSFSPWTYRGRIYGLPHDVHPVMLGYRSDIVEAAGIDVSQIETWDDFRRVLSPLMADKDGDGKPDRYLLGLYETDPAKIESLLMQAGGGYFEPDGSPMLSSDVNVRALARIVSWFAGPDAMATDVTDFTASGNKLKVDGYAVAYLMPDWMCSIWRIEMPQLAGKVKVMPLPAWEPGGRRTSVWGGTVLGISKASKHADEAWKVAKSLYVSREIAHRLYTELDIISPVKDFWGDAVYDQADPYFSGQRKGRMYIDLAPDVPRRVPSPYYRMAEERMRDAATETAKFLRANPDATRDELEEAARRALEKAQREVRTWMDRNVFLGAER